MDMNENSADRGKTHEPSELEAGGQHGFAQSGPDVVAASSAASVQPFQQVMPKNPGMAVVASFFVPGLGTIMNGQAGKGGLIMGTYAICVLLVFFVIGFLLAPAVWIWGMVDAYQGAKNWNAAHGVVS